MSLLTGERVLKLDRLSSVKPPFFHSLAAKAASEWKNGRVAGFRRVLTCETWAHARQAGMGLKHFEVVGRQVAGGDRCLAPVAEMELATHTPFVPQGVPPRIEIL